MFKVLFFSFLIAFAGMGSASTLLVMGDSISTAYGLEINKGWVTLLQLKLTKEGKDYTVINASISGETTSGGLSRINGELNQHRPRIVIIELGANDGLRGFSPKLMKSNLNKMITRAKSADAKVVLVGIRIPPNYGKPYTELFYNVFDQLEQEQQIIFVPFILDGIAGKANLMQPDGMHPTSEAQATMMHMVWEKLEPIL